MPSRRMPPGAARRWAPLVAVAVLGLSAAAGGAWALAGAVQTTAERRAVAALTDAGLGWVRAEADGMILRLGGTAPDAAAARAALAAAGAAAPTTRLADAMQRPADAPAATPQPAAAPPPQPSAPLSAPAAAVNPGAEDAPLTLAREADGISIAGPASAELVAALRTALAELPEPPTLRDGSLPDPGPTEPATLALARVAVIALAGLDEARAELHRPGPTQALRLHLAARLPDDAARRGLSRDLRARIPTGTALSLDLSAPPPAISPFRITAVTSALGPALLACDLGGEDDRALLRTALAEFGVPGAAAGCRVGLGAPSARWAEAAAAGLRALGSLESGRFELTDLQAQLISALPGPAASARLEAAGRILAEGLPNEFSVKVIGPEPPPGPRSRDAAEGGPAWLSLRKTAPTPEAPDGRVALLGTVPDALSAEVLATYARARFGAEAVAPDFERTDAAPPPALRRTALAAMDALALLDAGTARFDGDTLRLTGDLRAVATVQAVQAALAPTAAAGVQVSTALRMDLPALAAALPLPPADCLRALGAEVAVSPIGFAPGAAEIEVASGAVLDRLAAILRRCDGLTVEIGGHTDSQGRAETNRQLSEARAWAVLDALFARGAPMTRMTARGYGPDLPVASNATEAGRAANRRIGFADAALGAQPPEASE